MRKAFCRGASFPRAHGRPRTSGRTGAAGLHSHADVWSPEALPLQEGGGGRRATGGVKRRSPGTSPERAGQGVVCRGAHSWVAGEGGRGVGARGLGSGAAETARARADRESV